MNIFVTDKDPIISAQNLDDKRVFHMVRESIEMLSIYVHSVTKDYPVAVPMWAKWDGTRKGTQFLHNAPTSVWVRKHRDNVCWLFHHLAALLEEYAYRFEDLHPNESLIYAKLISPLVHIIGDSNIYGSPTFRNSSYFKNDKNVFIAYRKTMIQKWFTDDKVKPKWTKRGKPEWAVIEEQANIF